MVVLRLPRSWSDAGAAVHTWDPSSDLASAGLALSSIDPTPVRASPPEREEEPLLELDTEAIRPVQAPPAEETSGSRGLALLWSEGEELEDEFTVDVAGRDPELEPEDEPLELPTSALAPIP